MAVDVVKDVRLLQIVELVAATDKTGRRKATARQKAEKHVVGHQARYRDDAPAGGSIEDVAQPAKIRNAACGHAEPLQPAEIFGAGSAGKQALLPLEQVAPDGVLVVGVARPVLLDRVLRQNVAHRALRMCSPRPGNTAAARQSPPAAITRGISTRLDQAFLGDLAEMFDKRGHRGLDPDEAGPSPEITLVHVEGAIDLDLQRVPAA